MAAAEYYNTGGAGMATGAPQQQRPPLPPQNPNPLPYPISDLPPPYSAVVSDHRAHSQPPPQQRPPLHPNVTPQGGGYHNPYPPPPPSQQQNGDTYQYPPEKQVHFRPPAQQRPGATYPPPQQSFRPIQHPVGQQGYPFPNGQTPAMSQGYGEPQRRRVSTLGYDPSQPPYRYDGDYGSQSRSRTRSRSRSCSRSRSRSRSRKHRHHRHHQPQRPQPAKKDSGLATFLGAGGGALIGDLIIPGMGTLGGAILGGLGGHEYGKQRRSYSNDREYFEENMRRGRRKY